MRTKLLISYYKKHKSVSVDIDDTHLKLDKYFNKVCEEDKDDFRI